MRDLLTVARMLLAASIVCAGAGQALAQGEFDMHFQGDTVNRARVDDRGGTVDGYSFEIAYDDADTNSENFCSHCRFNLLAQDVGITMADLERMGVTRDDVDTLPELMATIEHLTSTPASTVAGEASPGISGTALDELTAEIEAILARWSDDPMTALEDVAEIAAGIYSFGSTPFSTLLPLFGVQLDSAFDYNFADPNDLRRANSGVEVYTSAEYINAVTGAGASEDVLNTINSVLSSLPLPGQFEISGDDDDANAPATFHARYTNLTVKQRTYVIQGASAYLLVYTIVNDTDRVLPFVEAAMIADFDIPPSSSDKETMFEPTTLAVMTYDDLPYEDPVLHWYFGVAPMTTLVGLENNFGFANFNLDDQLSLAQSNATSRENRYKFMLWHPDFLGDQDSATGKTEKQGALSVRLPVPLLPGDEKPLGFCFAGSVDTDKTTALAETITLLQACRTIFNAVVPICGDGVVQVGEECDFLAPAAPANCTHSCTLTVCGDGVLEVGEECDDGNIVSDDGCSATCLNEYCGDGVVQAGGARTEECDDGNASNADACLTDCRSARCGDGYLRVCDPATENCGCAGYAHCLQGTFTLTSGEATGAFATMTGHPINYLFAFDDPVITITGMLTWQVVTPPIHAEFTGDPYAADTLARAMNGHVWSFTIAGTEGTNRRLTTDSIRPARGGLFIGHQMDIDVALGRNVTWSFDSTMMNPLIDTLRFSNAAISVTHNARLLPTPVVETLSGTGDGRVADSSAATTGEVCDDGNASDMDECTNSCLPARCGDGIVQPVLGEACDDGAATGSCTATCTRIGSVCGNGTLEEGETCDDGNTTAGDGCSDLCFDEGCGDGIVQASLGETCDDGNTIAGDGCNATCAAETCGDGVLQEMLGEECDNGTANADTAVCTTACRNALCGDGFVLAGTEACDDGNTTAGDGCSDNCVVEVCGDGLPGPDEECDDGNAALEDGCTPECVREFCGDGILQAGLEEQCDDGNFAAGDGCSRDCQLENLAACGNGRLDTGEQCDDGNTTAGDGCSPFCQLENPDLCGNRRVDPGEGCDDGNTTAGDGCSARCSVETCGDGIQQAGEECDDGNTTAGDGCAADCSTEAAVCGNGIHEYGEECDDGNTTSGDGCSATCTVDSTAPVDLSHCGDGTLDPGESCDDGNRNDGDGCDETCHVEPAVCGNGRLERGEFCDDGNNAAGDLCPADCLEIVTAAVCGNGILEAGEACDDGNTTAGDGCSADCRVEPAPVPTDRSAGCSCGVAGAAGGSLLSLLVLGFAAFFRRRR
jgi:MYXO-CTERM domain-containing protein